MTFWSSVRAATFAAVLALGSITTLRGQALDCVLPREINASGQCTLKVPAGSPTQPLVLRVSGQSGPAANVDVTFTVRTGSGSVTPFATSGPTGLVEATWSGKPAGTTVISASATVAGRQVVREIVVDSAAGATRALTLAVASGDEQTWYEKRQLPRPVVVTVSGADASCTGAVVYFRPMANGAVSPDSVYAVPEPDPNTRVPTCIARSYWKLGEGVGTQNLIAGIRGQPSENKVLQARARLLPRIGAGLAVTHNRQYFMAKKDSATGTIAVDTVHATEVFHPVISVDFPMFRRIPGLRASVAASANSIDRDWYTGVSVIQPFYGISTEALGVDVHLVAHVGRRRVLDSVSNCSTGVNCDDHEKVMLLGGGVMFFVETAGLLSTIAGAFSK